MGIHGTPDQVELRTERPRSAHRSILVNDWAGVWLRRSAAHTPPLYAGSSYGGG
jgi:hypothetical protein